MELRKFWGKLDGKDESQRHSLVAHSADVAAVCEALLKQPLWERRLEKLSSGLDVNVLRSRLCFFTALHDIAKLASAFQLSGDLSHEKKIRRVSHVTTGQALSIWDLREKLAKTMPEFSCWEPEISEAGEGTTGYPYLNALLSHHGTSTWLDEAPSQTPQKRWWDDVGDLKPWAAMSELRELVRSWFPEAWGNEAPMPPSTELQHLFAGLLTLSDWIGSTTTFFPFEGTEGRPVLIDPMSWSRRAAHEAVTALGLQRLDPLAGSVPFSQHFGFAPNSLQGAIDELPLSSDGGLYVVEAPTGCGKTEAALRLFYRLYQSGFVDGLYFANPSRLASTQLYSRMLRFGDNAFEKKLPCVLAVPGYVMADGVEGIRLPEYQVVWSDPEGYLARSGWAAESPKRFLSAPLAVGTIDQALLAMLRMPHAHLRAASLQRSLLVIDEIHSSDSYMSELNKSLLQWFFALGGHVLLMSATLSVETRDEYMEQWAPRRPRKSLSTKERCAQKSQQKCKTSDDRYPLISWKAGGQSNSRIIEPSWQSKEVVVETLPLMEKSDELADFVARQMVSGEENPSILLLRNTVGLARSTVNALACRLRPEQLFSMNGVVTAHHGRFASSDRKCLDCEVELRYGKGNGVSDLQFHRPGSVLTSTQTVEQSLDVDFDLLITDWCPVDVLLQRIGRLFRHQRWRPEGFRKARCIVLLPEGDAVPWLLSRKAGSCGFGKDRAYRNLLSLLATRFEVERTAQLKRCWILPDDNRKLVEGATGSAALNKLKAQFPELEEASYEFWGTSQAEKQMACDSALKWDKAFDARVNFIGRDRSMTTRLGGQDLLCTFAQPVMSPLGQLLDTVKIPSWMIKGKLEDWSGDPVETETREGVIYFSLGKQQFRYDAFGLAQTE